MRRCQPSRSQVEFLVTPPEPTPAHRAPDRSRPDIVGNRHRLNAVAPQTMHPGRARGEQIVNQGRHLATGPRSERA
jgi:hypothetical protein